MERVSTVGPRGKCGGGAGSPQTMCLVWANTSAAQPRLHGAHLERLAQVRGWDFAGSVGSTHTYPSSITEYLSGGFSSLCLWYLPSVAFGLFVCLQED